MKLTEQLAKLEREIQEDEERKREKKLKVKMLRTQISQQQRKTDNRRHILLGVAVEEAVKSGIISRDQIDLWLDSFIRKQNDRRFLGLEDAV
ncbi:MAG: hypothetical protein ABW165_14455 [Candidatus Thiodiazotropha sp.]